MPSLDEYAEILQEQPEGLTAEPMQEPTVRSRWQLPEWMKAKSSKEPLESFIEHPLNWDQDKDLARAVRGITSMFDALDYAFIDVLVGLFRYAKKKKPIDPPGPTQGFQV